MEKEEKEYQISNFFNRIDEDCRFEIAFKRWLVYEIETKNITVVEALKTFNVSRKMISYWREKFSAEIVLPLEDMTAEEKQKMELLQNQLKEAEKRLEDASIKLLALNTLIDVAEEKLKINIRKKSGAKQ